jgi:hypothetical protein
MAIAPAALPADVVALTALLAAIARAEKAEAHTSDLDAQIASPHAELVATMQTALALGAEAVGPQVTGTLGTGCFAPWPRRRSCRASADHRAIALGPSGLEAFVSMRSDAIGHGLVFTISPRARCKTDGTSRTVAQL